MADERGVRWIVRWVTDRVSRRRVEMDGEASARRVESAWRRSTTRIRGMFTRMGAALKTQFGQIAAAVAAFFAVRTIINFGKEIVRVANEAQQIWSNLAATLATVGVRYEDVAESIAKVARATQDVTTVGDEDFAVILQELVSTSRNYEKSLKAVSVVIDLAAAKHIDFKTAATLVGRAMVGQTQTLTRYGIVVREGEDAVEAMRKQFAGIAENEAKTLTGRVAQLKNEWSDFKQALGEVLIVASGGQSLIESLIGTIKRWTESINANQLRWAAWTRVVLLGLKAIIGTLGGLIRIAWNVGNTIGDILVLVFVGIKLEWSRLVAFVQEGINDIIRALNLLPGVAIELIKVRDVAQQERAFHRAVVGMKMDIGEAADALDNLVQRWVDFIVAAQEASTVGPGALDRVVNRAAAVTPPTPGETLAGMQVGEPNKALLEKRALSTIQIPLTLEPTVDTERYAEIMEWLQQQSLMASETMIGHWEVFFDRLIFGFESGASAMEALGSAAVGIGESVVAELIKGWAAHEQAAGVAALAAGTWPPNPAAIASASLHFAAAGLFRALGSTLQRRATGGGFFGGSRFGSNMTDRGGFSDRTRTRGAEVHIYLDPFNPNNPLHQRQVKAAYDLAQQRFGDQVPVSIHYGSGR